MKIEEALGMGVVNTKAVQSLYVAQGGGNGGYSSTSQKIGFWPTTTTTVTDNTKQYWVDPNSGQLLPYVNQPSIQIKPMPNQVYGLPYTGQLMWDPTENAIKVWTGSAWITLAGQQGLAEVIAMRNQIAQELEIARKAAAEIVMLKEELKKTKHDLERNLGRFDSIIEDEDDSDIRAGTTQV